MKFLLLPPVVGLLGVSLANAHFTLDYPPTRGLEHAKMNQSVCGGFDVPGNRTPFPLTGGKIQVSPGHPAVMYAEIAFDSNPTNLSQFNTTSDGVNYKKLVDFNAVYNTTLCWNADISSLNVLAAKDGANATLVVVYATETSTLYQCSDLTLSSTATIPGGAIFSNVTCMTVKEGSYTSTAGHPTSTAPSPSQTPSSGAVAACSWLLNALGILGAGVFAVGYI